MSDQWKMTCTRCPRTVELESGQMESERDWEESLEVFGCKKTTSGWICDYCSGHRQRPE